MLPWGSTVELPHVGRRTRAFSGGASALRGAARAGARVAVRRRADAVDDAVGGRLPRGRGRGVREPRALRGRRRVRRSLPGRHGGDGGPFPAAGARRAAGAARDHDDAADRGRGLGGRGTRAPLRAAALAVHADRHRRQPDGAAGRADAHRAPARAGLLLLLPRLGGRGVRGGCGWPHRLARRERRPARGRRGHHGRGRVQRPRRAGGRAARAARSRASWPSRR